MIEWINPKDRLPEEYHHVLVKIDGNVHVARIEKKLLFNGLHESFWFADDTIMIWPAEDASCWAEIPMGQKDTNAVESKPEESHTFDYNSAMMWLMLIMVLGSLGNCKAESKSGWVYKDSGKEYKGAIYTGKDMFADKDGNEIIYIPPSKR